MRWHGIVRGILALFVAVPAIAMPAGSALARVPVFFALRLRADQLVSGVSMSLLGLAITGFLDVDTYGTQGTPDSIPRAPDVKLPGIKDIPFVGDVIGQMNVL